MLRKLMWSIESIEYSDDYSKTSPSLWQYYKDEPVTNDDRFITDFTANDNSDSFKFENN